MTEFKMKPEVNAAREFTEIAKDFSNPLDLVREAISNSFDARATEIRISFEGVRHFSRDLLITTIEDNGEGMDQKSLKWFFDLGNSSRDKDDESTIGEKGHGTKVYFNSSKIKVETTHNGNTLEADMDSPHDSVYSGTIPDVSVKSFTNTGKPNGTKIIIEGYNFYDNATFTHESLKDHIRWFTKFGAIEAQFGIQTHKDVKLYLKGLDWTEDKPDELSFGHYFPAQSPSTEVLFAERGENAPEYYCRRWIRTGHLKKNPNYTYQAVFYVEGNQIRYGYNNLLRRRGKPRVHGDYTVQERYGLWLCKDYIPIQRKNEWITKKGSEFTRFHAFINCQRLNLTANRGSCDNTPAIITEDLQEIAGYIREEIESTKEWIEFQNLWSQAEATRTVKKELAEYDNRLNKINSSNIACYNGLTLTVPNNEIGVISMVIQLMTIDPKFFPFRILDYDSHSGFDAIAVVRPDIPIRAQELQYVEFKYILGQYLNHSFKNLHSIICWDN